MAQHLNTEYGHVVGPYQSGAPPMGERLPTLLGHLEILQRQALLGGGSFEHILQQVNFARSVEERYSQAHRALGPTDEWLDLGLPEQGLSARPLGLVPRQ